MEKYSLKNLNLIDLFDSYCVLRKLEDTSADFYGNVDYVFSCLFGDNSNVLDLFEHLYNSRGI